MQKFSKQSKANFLKSAATFNSMAGRAKNKYGATVEKIDVDKMLKNLHTTDELKEFTKTLKDYKHIADFKPDENTPFASRGEIQTFKRTSAAKKSKKTRQANKLRLELPKATATRVMEIQHELTKLETREKKLSDIKDRDSLTRAIGAAEKYNLKFDTTSANKYMLSYIKRVRDLGNESGVPTDVIEKALLKMSPKKFTMWAQGGGHNLKDRYGRDAFKELLEISEDLNVNLDEEVIDADMVFDE